MNEKIEEKCQKEAEAAYRKLDPKQPALFRLNQTCWRSIATEFRHVPGTMGDFHFHLCEAIVRADLANTERLKKAYPELVHWLQEVDL